MKNHFKIFFFFSLSFSVSLYGQEVSFYRETITLNILSDSTFKVDACYWFKNSSHGNYQGMLYYPFLVDENHFAPDSIVVTNAKSEKLPILFMGKTGVTFPVVVHADDSTFMNVKYYQRSLNESAEYILTTTSGWQKALEKGEYAVRLPIEFELLSLSYNPEEVETVKNIIVYKFTRSNFLPQKNFVVHWRRKLQ